jgi:hypothetical protein
MAAKKTPTITTLSELKAEFARCYLDRSKGVYSIGIGREDGELCLRVSASKTALRRLPNEFKGARVEHRVGAPGVVALGGRF